MKPACLSLLLISCFFACTSPDTKTKTAAQTKPKDSTAVTDTVVSHPYVYTPVIFLAEQGITVPPYGLEKIKGLVAKLESVDDTTGNGESIEMLDEQDYSRLSIAEKFTYHMIHPETYSQMCDILPERTDGANRIYGHLEDTYGEYEWSRRQLDFFKDNRDSVELMMKSIIEKNNEVGPNFEEAIVDMNGTEMIPDLISYYNKDRKDHYILTVLMLLMKKNEYPEFINSLSCKKLYNTQHDEYSNYLVYNKANEDLIIQRATNFYNGLSKK